MAKIKNTSHSSSSTSSMASSSSKPSSTHESSGSTTQSSTNTSGSSSANILVATLQECHNHCAQAMIGSLSANASQAIQQEHISSLQACIEICQETASYVLKQGIYADHLCEITARVCESCADHCEEAEENGAQHWQQCAQICRKAAEACRVQGKQLRSTDTKSSQRRTSRTGREEDRRSVRELMISDPEIISGDTTLDQAAQKMEAAGTGVLPVGSKEKLEGIITDRDIVLRAVAKGKDVKSEVVRDYMTSDRLVYCQDTDTADDAAEQMREHNVSRLLVRDENDALCGILTFGQLIREESQAAVEKVASSQFTEKLSG